MPPFGTSIRRMDAPCRRQPLAALLRCCAPLRSVALRAPSFAPSVALAPLSGARAPSFDCASLVSPQSLTLRPGCRGLRVLCPAPIQSLSRATSFIFFDRGRPRRHCREELRGRLSAHSPCQTGGGAHKTTASSRPRSASRVQHSLTDSNADSDGASPARLFPAAYRHRRPPWSSRFLA